MRPRRALRSARAGDAQLPAPRAVVFVPSRELALQVQKARADSRSGSSPRSVCLRHLLL